ncbi:hypothetical protein [Carboxylicivirga marina]|uniref:hypothetical protein n=1 Tax=Carboxylicivirga marina TaxID=2800988 RepID=UPI0025982CA2|nr:hypothetical protein [uncultured Carboxylicivirga sp.]
MRKIQFNALPMDWKLEGKEFRSKIVVLLIMLFVLSCHKEARGLPEEDDNMPVDTESPEFDRTIKVGDPTGKKVTAYLTGLNTVYAHEDMRTWDDGNKLNHLTNTGISALRYPEGHQVSFWDWEFPYHEPYQDIWNPNYESTLTQAKRDELKEKNKNRMLIDNYFEICRDGNIEPVMGINMFQGWKFDRNEESIQKAVRLVEYCLKQNPKVTYFFLDNEAGHQPEQNNHVPIEEYIQLIPAYSQAIKAIHPEAKLIPNIMRWNVVERMIRETGQYWDVYDNHWYYGSGGKWAYFNLNEWRAEVESEQQVKKIADFNSWKQQYGMEHLEFSYMEWNAPPPNLTADSNPSSLSYAMMGLIQADQLMFFANNDIHMATAWPLMWETESKDTDLSKYNRNLLDKDDSSWLSPSATIFQAYSHVQNGEILENDNDPNSGLRVLAVKREANKGYAVLVLNKSSKDKTIELELPDSVRRVIEGKHFTEGEGVHNVEIKTLSPEFKENKVYISIEGTSFAYLLFDY